MDAEEKWEGQITEYPIKHCGRLDMATYMPTEETLGRVTSDRVRYVYFEDGSECIVLGKLCDHVAYRAARHDDLRAALQERDQEIERLRSRLAAAEEDRAESQRLGEQAIDELSAIRVKLAAVEEERDRLRGILHRSFQYLPMDEETE